MLKEGENGFFLMVESGRIDHAHHDNTANRAIEEAVQMDFSIEAALDLLKDELDETLIIATADHAHQMTISGYNNRGSDITELNDGDLDDGLPYLTLNYANGPGFFTSFDIVDGNVTRVDLRTVDVG